MMKRGFLLLGIGLGMVLLVSCGQSKMIGTVQKAQVVEDHFVLSLGAPEFAEIANYAFVDLRVLMDNRFAIAPRKSTNPQEPDATPGAGAAMSTSIDAEALAVYGNRFVGKRVCFYGEIETDSGGRQFIRIKDRSQIQVLH